MAREEREMYKRLKAAGPAYFKDERMGNPAEALGELSDANEEVVDKEVRAEMVKHMNDSKIKQL